MTPVFLAVIGVIYILLVFKYPPLSLTLFITTPVLKGYLMMNFSIFQKIDYTVLCTVFTLIMMTYYFVKSRGQLREIFRFPVLVYLALGFLLLFGVLSSSSPNYGFEKSSKFITFGLISFIAPIMFSRTFKDIKLMVWITLFVGIALAITTLIFPHKAIIRVGADTRASFLEASTLTTAVLIGSSLIIASMFATMYSSAKKIRIGCMVAIPVLITGMIITGSRGPFAGLLLTLTLGAFICRKKVSKIWFPLIGAVLMVAMVTAFIRLPENTTLRIRNMWKSKYDMKEAGSSRMHLFTWTTSRVGENIIFGHGTGSFAVDKDGVDKREYPHNYFLELLYEQGLIGTFLGGLLLWLIFRRWWVSSRYYAMAFDDEMNQIIQTAGLLFFFYFLQAMKSGDIDDNRFMFFFAGLVVAIFGWLERSLAEGYVAQEFGVDDSVYVDEQDFDGAQNCIDGERY